MTDQPLWPLDDSQPIAPRPAGVVELPLSAPQQRWWFLCTRYPGGSSPVVFLVHRLRGRLDVDAWVASVGDVADRHESLRAHFELRNGGPVQVIDPPSGLPVEVVDLADPSAEARLDRAREVIDERRRITPDLLTGPLVSSCLVRLADDDHIWTMTIHHILADGVSLGIIDHDVATLYRARLDGGRPELPHLPVQFGDYVWAEMKWPSPHDDERRYWLHQLAEVPPLDLPLDHPRPAEKGAPAAEVDHRIGPELARRIDELAKSTRCTIFMALLALLAVLLGRLAGQEDFSVGTPVVGTGRLRDELAWVVGLFANTLGLRMDLSGDPTVREVLGRTRQTVFDAVDHQELPFAQVIEDQRLPYEPGRPQLFQVLFILDEFDPTGGATLPGLRIEEFPVAVPKTLHDLMVYVWSSPTGLTARFVFDSGLFTVKSVAAWAQDFEDLLWAATARPDARLSEL